MKQEEKAKAYDEAMNKIKPLYEQAKRDGNPIWSTYEYLIPELRESEDERIRKHLIEIVETYWGKTNEPGKAADLAWLEKQKEQDHICDSTQFEEGFKTGLEIGLRKQKEQKPNIEICPHSINSKSYSETGYPIEDCDYGLEIALDILEKTLGEVQGYQTDDGLREHQTAIKAVKDAMKEQKPVEVDESTKRLNENWMKQYFDEPKPVEWSEDYRDEDLRTRFAFYTYKDEDDVLYLSNVFVEETSRNKGFGTKILAAAEKVAEIIGAINIRLKVKQNSPANAWYRKNGYGYVTFEDGYDWLEKTLEYMKPNKPEWTEADENMRNNIISVLSLFVGTVACDSNPSLSSSYLTYLREIDWLKSLRPQQKVEWSEEDKATVGCIACCLDGSFVTEAARKQCLEWFNKHRRDFLNSPSWKPSEEQIYSLGTVVKGYNECNVGSVGYQLKEMYEQLKKL